MKKLAALLLVLALMLTAVGCAAQTAQPETRIEPEVAPPTDTPAPADEPADDSLPDDTTPADEVALTEPGIEESWTGTILEVFTEGGGEDSAQVVKVQSGEDTVCFTLEQSSSCVRSSSGEEESIAPSELVPGAQVEIEGFRFSDSSYRPISVIRVLEEEAVNIHPVEVSPVSVQPTDEQPEENTAAPLTEPPALTVVNGSMRIEALRGGYEWRQKEDDGTVCTVIADCAHPLDMQTLVSALPCQPARAGELDAHTAYLCFDVLPDKLTVRCWSTDCWGDSDAESTPVFVTLAESEPSLDAPTAKTYRIPITENDCVYEVTATWNGDDSCGGSATYSFYTRWADAEIILPRVEVYDK